METTQAFLLQYSFFCSFLKLITLAFCGLLTSHIDSYSLLADANGGGWWDCSMEGVDDEEVGFGQVWEGVGSTTFGGIEWH